MEYNYRPLPRYLTIKPSPIDGLGVFAKEDIIVDKYIIFGPTHMLDGGVLYRLDFGGFINNSEDPNCFLIEYETKLDKKLFSILVDRNISAGVELTLNYNDSFKVLKLDYRFG